jgi:hypothetical protein
MLVQPLDDKGECIGYYTNGHLTYGALPEEVTGTWGYTPHLNTRAVQYAHLYCGGQSLGEACPESLRLNWQEVSTKLKAYLRSFGEGKIALDDHCFYNLVPERFLLEFFDTKQRITEHVLKNYPQPDNYDFLVDLSRVLLAMSQRELKLDLNPLKSRLGEKRVRDFWKKILKKGDNKVVYNLFGTKTGRLTTKRGSFPILTLDTSLRSVIRPNNNWLVEIDLNGAELRTLLALSGHEQPTEDLHEWNMKNIFDEDMTRAEAKKKIFAWLYNPKALNKKAEAYYNKELVLEKHYNGERVQTFYGRTIPADDHHALNYIIQSTTSDLFLRQLCVVDKMLEGRKSYVSLCIHDSMVLDLHNDDKPLLPEILRTFSQTELGDYKINVSVGKDFGNMERIAWKQ